MSIVAWIVLGLIVGLIANRLMANRSDSLTRHVGLGIAGGLIGGWLANLLGVGTFGDLNPWSAVAAAVGAASMLALYNYVWRNV